VREQGDLHTLTAKMLDIQDRKRAGGYIETARQRGKTFNFSIIYGGGLRTIRKQQRCSQDEARRMRQRYYDAYPEVSRLQDHIESKLDAQGYISDRVISGRRFRVDVREAYKAVNYLVQGTAASVLKEAMIKLHADGVPMVALVHDEIVAHVPTSEAEEVKDLIIRRMTENEAIKEMVGPGLSADGEIVQRWSDAKPMKDGSLFVPRWAQEMEEEHGSTHRYAAA
jgi:DNA polymerase-1